MALAFEAGGEYASFRKPYTTTSSETYSFPTPTAVAGMISAILGYCNGSDHYASAAEFWGKICGTGTQIGIKINKPAATVFHTLNHLYNDTSKDVLHTQIRREVLKRPLFTIFVRGGIEDKLARNLEEERYEYLPNLGMADMPAQIKYLGQEQDQAVDWSTPHVIDTVLPLPNDGPGDKRPKLITIRRVKSEIVPLEMGEDRRHKRSIRVLTNEGMPDAEIVIKENNGYFDVTECFRSKVAWFPAW